MRITSPDHIVDAVLVAEGTDATVSTPKKLYIVPSGASFRGDNPVLVADNFEIKSLHWAAPKKLTLSFYKGRIFKYTNFWSSRRIDNFRYIVTIYLQDSNYPQ